MRAVVSATHEIVFYVPLQHNDMMSTSCCTGNHIFCLELNLIVKQIYQLFGGLLRPRFHFIRYRLPFHTIHDTVFISYRTGFLFTRERTNPIRFIPFSHENLEGHFRKQNQCRVDIPIIKTNPCYC